MIQPILTTAQSQLSGYFAQLTQGQRKPFTVSYSFQGCDFISALGFWRGIDDNKAFICPSCGCCVRVLAHYAERPGLACVACVSIEAYKADTRAERITKGSKASKPMVSKSKPTRQPRRKATKKVA